MTRTTNLKKRITLMIASIAEQEKTRFLNTFNQTVFYDVPPNSYASSGELYAYNLAKGLDIPAKIKEINAAGFVAFLYPTDIEIEQSA